MPKAARASPTRSESRASATEVEKSRPMAGSESRIGPWNASPKTLTSPMLLGRASAMPRMPAKAASSAPRKGMRAGGRGEGAGSASSPSRFSTSGTSPGEGGSRSGPIVSAGGLGGIGSGLRGSVSTGFTSEQCGAQADQQGHPSHDEGAVAFARRGGLGRRVRFGRGLGFGGGLGGWFNLRLRVHRRF